MNRFAFLSLALATACGIQNRPAANAKVTEEFSTKHYLKIEERSGAIAVTSSLESMLDDVRQTLPSPGLAVSIQRSYVQCTSISEIKKTLLCIFNGRDFMNLALNRAATFVEEGGRLQNHDEHSYDNRPVEGHDLKAADLKTYWQYYNQEKPNMSMPSLEPERIQLEEDFWDYLLPMLEDTKDLVIIATHIDSDLNETISHEMLHAQYFHTPKYQDIVHQFWDKQVSSSDQEKIKEVLSDYYNPNDRDLIINEFQAYMLMNGAGSSQLKEFVGAYRLRLMQALKESNINPIEVEL